MRRAAKVDANQNEIVFALRSAGCSVTDLSAVGAGCPDLVVGRGGQNYLLEIKGRKGKLTEAQREWRACWNGQAATVRTVGEAFAAVGLERRL